MFNEWLIRGSQINKIRVIFKMKRYKRMGLREIARELNKNSALTARGGKCHGRTIKYMLKNPIYKSTAQY